MRCRTSPSRTGPLTLRTIALEVQNREGIYDRVSIKPREFDAIEGEPYSMLSNVPGGILEELNLDLSNSSTRASAAQNLDDTSLLGAILL